jgi:hypothetical protein
MFDLLRDTTPIVEDEAKAMFGDVADAIAATNEKGDQGGVIDLESICSGEMRVHDGDLDLDELRLRAEGPSLFVDGNLVVRGLIEQEFRAGFLVVFGDLEARDVATTAQIFVTGNLTVHGTLYGNCTNYATSVLGHTRAKAIVSAKGHLFGSYGGRTAERVVDLRSRTELVDGIDSGYDERAVADVLRRGGSILR